MTSALSYNLVTRTFADFDLKINVQINTQINPAAPTKVDATLWDSGIGSNHVTVRITIPPTVTNAIRNIFNDLSIIASPGIMGTMLNHS